MKVNKTLTALIASAGLGLSGTAFAAGTDAGVDITNTVNLDYKVNSVPQQVVESEAAFKVDTRVDMTLTDNNSSYEVAPGSTVTYTYSLTNTGNDTLYFALALENQSQDTTDTGDITISGVTFTKVSGDGSITNGLVELPEDGSITYTAEFTFPKQTSAATPANIEHNDTFLILAKANAVQSDGTALVNGKSLDKNSSANLAGQSLNVFAEAESLESNALNAEITVGTETTIKSAWFTDGAGKGGPKLEVLAVNDDLCDANYDSSAATPNYGNYDTVNGGETTCDASTGGYTPKALPGSLVEYTLTTKNEGLAIAEDAVFAVTLADINGFIEVSPGVNSDTGLDAFKANSLDNVNITFTKVAGGVNTARKATNNSNSSALKVDVDFFEPGDEITIRFTAIVE